MTKLTRRLLQARTDAPADIRGPEFDAWFWPLILETLEPVQNDLMQWLVLVNHDDALCTSDLCVAARGTPNQIGAALSDLRKLGLVETTHRVDDDATRRAYHIAVKWVRAASALVLQWDKERMQELMNTPPIYGRRSWRDAD